MSINARIKEALGAKGITHAQLAEYMEFELPAGRVRITSQLRGNDTDSIKLVKAVSEITGYYFQWLAWDKGLRFPGKTEKWTEINPEINPPDYRDTIPERLNRLEKMLEEVFEELSKPRPLPKLPKGWDWDNLPDLRKLKVSDVDLANPLNLDADDHELLDIYAKYKAGEIKKQQFRNLMLEYLRSSKK